MQNNKTTTLELKREGDCKKETIIILKNFSERTIKNYFKNNIECLIKLKDLQYQELNLIEPIRKYDKKEYMIAFKNIYPNLIDPPETIYEYTTDTEFDMISRVIEAEIGIGSFNQKVNIATCIINRYQNDNKSWKEILTERHQFTTISNGAWRRVKVTDETKLALEYAWLFSNENLGNATYFRSGNDTKGWHNTSNKLKKVYFDGLHHFYKEK